MSEVTDAPARGETSGCGNADGSFIWYELITPDPTGAKAFYDEVVGWSIADHLRAELVCDAPGDVVGVVINLF